MIGTIGYDDWTGLLGEAFFPERSAGRRVFLFADDDALAAIHPSGDPTEACSSLAHAIATRLGDERLTANVFRVIEDEHKEWFAGSRAAWPPSLPLLAVAVNAATHMHGDDDVAPHNYYHRFRQLIGMTAFNGEPAGYGQTLPRMWKALRSWLDEDLQGTRGLSTIRSQEHWPYISWALSQALFRESDARRLTSLFVDLELPSSEEWDPTDLPITKEELGLQYKFWAPSAGLSSGARLLASEKSVHDDLLEQILWDEAKNWHGTEITAGGTRAGRIQLLLTASRGRFALEFVLARNQNQQADEWQGRPLTFSHPAGHWYDETPLVVAPDALDRGLQVRTANGLDYSYVASDIVVLRVSDELGGWVSTNRVEPNTDHWLLIHHDLRHRVEDYLREFAVSDWTADSPSGIPDDWTLVRNVRIQTSPPRGRFEELRKLHPVNRLRLSYRGGLPVRDLGPQAYLTGGAPDLWIPPAIASEDGGRLYSDGREIAQTGPQGGEIRLSKLDLGEGVHTLEASYSKITLKLISGLGRVSHPSAGSRGSLMVIDHEKVRPVTRRVTATQVSDNVITIAGGIVRGAPPGSYQKPESLRVNATAYYLLGAVPGEIEQPHQPDPPTWLQRADLDPGRFDVVPPFTVVWILYAWGGGMWQASRREALEPQGPYAQSEDVAEWAALITDCETALLKADRHFAESYISTANRVLESIE